MRARSKRRLWAFGLVGAALSSAALGQQQADADFRPVVARPMHEAGQGPRVLIDEGHHNFHTASGRYKPFADLLTADGCRVGSRSGVFTEAAMPAIGDVLVIANARGSEGMQEKAASQAAFTPEECVAVAAWVRAGGSLLLVADHAPFGSAAAALGEALGVTMSKGWMLDVNTANQSATTPNPTFLRFSRENGLLGDHAITRGRDESERLNVVVTFTGQGLRGPEGSTAFLKLSPTARNAETREKTREVAAALAPETPDGTPREKQPNEQRGGETRKALEKVPESERWEAQGLAFRLGKGRVVVMGEAACMTAQALALPAILAGAGPTKVGMNVPGTDDQQMTLNLVRWLAGEIGE